MIEACIFDVFGTVVDWRSGVAREVGSTFAEKGVDVDALAFADHWRGLYQPAMQAIRSGARDYHDLDVLHLENLTATLQHFGHAHLFEPDEILVLNHAWEKLPPWPDSVAGLERLKRKLIIAPCSNGSIALMTRLARFGRLPWDCILGAGLARAYKPDLAVYRACCSALRLPPDRVMMVAAHNDDLHAARQAGLKTAFIPRPAEHGPGQDSDLAPDSGWDRVVTSLADLA